MIDGAIPGLLVEQRFGKRNGVARDKALLVRADGEFADTSDGLSSDLSERYRHGRCDDGVP